MCNCEEESTTLLFLLCHFAWACWHGSPLVVHTSNIIDTSVQQWLSYLIISHNWNEEGFLEYMQNIFTTLWTIWFHRNMVIHKGKPHNPMEVILIAQNLSCRYKEVFSSQPSPHIRYSRPSNEPNTVTGQCNSWLKLQGLEAQGSTGVLGLMKLKISRELSNFMVWLATKKVQIMGLCRKLWWKLSSQSEIMVFKGSLFWPTTRTYSNLLVNPRNQIGKRGLSLLIWMFCIRMGCFVSC